MHKFFHDINEILNWRRGRGRQLHILGLGFTVQTTSCIVVEPSDVEQVFAVRAVAPVRLEPYFLDRLLQQAHVGQAQVHRCLPQLEPSHGEIPCANNYLK